MSQSTAKARRRTPARTTPAKPDGIPEPSEAATAENGIAQTAGKGPPGVVVLRVPQEGGNEEVQIMPINGMDPLAIPTLLKYALKIHHQNIGLED